MTINELKRLEQGNRLYCKNAYPEEGTVTLINSGSITIEWDRVGLVTYFFEAPSSFEWLEETELVLTLDQKRRKIVQTQLQKVKYLNTLRDIVARRLPKNEMGVAIVSDYDLLDAEPAEIEEALSKIQ